MNLEFLYKLRQESAITVIEYITNLGIIWNKYTFPKCGNEMSLTPRSDLSDGFQWACRKYSAPSHQVRRSIRTGTWFAVSKMSMKDILLVTYFLINRIDHRFIMQELQVSPRTVCEWHCYVHAVCVDACLRMNDPIGGVGMVVEIDEFKFGKRKSNLGRMIEGDCVFGGIERGTKSVFQGR